VASRFSRRDVFTLLQTPTQPAPYDTDFAAFAESLELAMVALYNDMTLRLSAENFATAARFRDHHQEHANAYRDLAAGKATGKPNSGILFATAPALQAVSDDRSGLSFLMGLENQMAETYAYGLTLLTAPDVYDRVVTTLPIESGHAAAFGATLQLSSDGLFITGSFENASVGDGTDVRRGFDMSAFPVG
jgi:hypothetical protein